MQITPIEDAAVSSTQGIIDLYNPEHPELAALADFDQQKVELIGAVKLDLGGRTALLNIDISVPATEDAAAQDQYIATELVNFRGQDEHTLVDLAAFDEAACAFNDKRCVVTTGFIPGFPLIFGGGVFGIHRAQECIAFAIGWAKVGDVFSSAYVSAGVTGAALVASLPGGQRTRKAMAVPCDTPVSVEIRTYDEQPIDTADCGGITLSRGEVCELLGTLTDDIHPPVIDQISVTAGEIAADPLGPLTATFSESIDPESVDDTTCSLTGTNGPVRGKCVLSEDGRVLRFVPEIRLRFGEEYTWRIDGVRDLGGQTLTEPLLNTFTTFAPRVLQHIDIDARQVIWLDPEALGRSPCEDFIAVVEGDAKRLDLLGGITIYDVTDLSEPPIKVAEIPTAGVDRALHYAAPGPITTTGDGGATYDGPFLVSVDGPGDSDRYGVWRLFDLSGFPTITPVTTRLINHSAESWRHFNIGDPLLGAPPVFLNRVPNDFGVPLAVAGFGTDVSYIANTPHIGLQAIALQDMTADFAAVPQVDGTLLGTYRGVTTLKDKVLALRQDGSTNQLVMANAQLQGLLDVFPIPGNARPNAITGLANWPSRAAFGAEQIQPVDLAAVPHNAGIAIVPVDVAAGRFAPDLFTGDPADIRTPGGSPQGAVGDRDTQLLYVADGTAGLTIVDLAVPTGRRDLDGDGIDDRVLGTLDLSGARAHGVVQWRDPFGRSLAAVASSTGIHIAVVGKGDVEPAPDVLRVNTNFDEGRIDAETGYAQADAVTVDLTAVSGDDAGTLIVKDLHSGYFGARPGRLSAECFTSCILGKVPAIDPETGQPESGVLRVHAIRALGTASEEHWAIPLGVNLLPVMYDQATAIIPSGDDVTYWLEGVTAGPITFEFRCESPEIGASSARQSFLVATHQTKAQWQEEIRQQVLLQEQLLHPQVDSVDLLDFQLPNGFMANRPHIQSVYRFYESMFVVEPTTMLWSGLSKLAGAPVYAGLSDSEWGRFFSVDIAASEIDVLQNTMMTINLDIMSDMAWQFRAYLASGIWALRYVSEDEARGNVTMFRPTLIQLDLDPWEDLARADTDLNGSGIALANWNLLRREQEFIAQPGWDIIGQESTLPLLPEWILSVLSESPVPDGKPFRQVIGTFGDVTKFPQRWQWIDAPDGIWSDWLAMPPAARLAEAHRPLKERAAEYSIVSTLACIPTTDICLAIQ